MSTRTLHTRTIAPFFAALAWLAPGVAQAQYIDLPGTQPGGLADGAPLDDARSCGVTCHYSRNTATLSAMPFDTWIGSMMGNTLRDPLFLASLTVAEQDSPGMGDWCLRCHTPPGFIGGRTRGNAGAALGNNLNSSDRDGVTCDSCHRSVETMNVSNGQQVFSPSEVRFGPHATIDSIRHPGAVSPWLAGSRACGVCHEIANPRQPQRSATGTDTGRRFPLDTTYTEWANSAYAVAGSADAASCVDCHLPRLGMPGTTSTNMTAVRRDNPRRHDMVGSNAWGLRVMAAMRNDVAAGEFYDPDLIPLYEAGARRAEAMLRTAVAVEIRTAPPTTARAGDTIEVTARITNRSGHRVPTGYGDGRRMWLEVALVESDGYETVLSGRYDTAAAHLDTDAQLRVYEQQPGRAGMGAESHIALHDTIVRDTRLPPKGYRPLPGHEPVGVDYSGGEGGALRHWDDARYMLTIPATVNGAVTLRVRARYQVTTREYVDFLVAREPHRRPRPRAARALRGVGPRGAFEHGRGHRHAHRHGRNARPDAGPDASTDASVDASADVPSDARADARTDAPSDARSDVSETGVTDAGADVTADVAMTDAPAPTADTATPPPTDAGGGSCNCTATAPSSPRASIASMLVALVVAARSMRSRRKRDAA